METGYRKLIAWQKAFLFAKKIYMETENFPDKERFGITSQLRRSALSVPTNLAEGCGRQSRKVLKQFVSIALGSLAESEFLLDFSFEFGLLSRDAFLQLQAIRQETGRLVWKLFTKL